MSRRTRRTYTQDFKVEAVKLVTEQGYTVTEAAKNLGVGLSTLNKWKCAYEQTQDVQSAFPGQGYQKPDDARLKQMEKELEKVRRERDILKKALGYFANPPG